MNRIAKFLIAARNRLKNYCHCFGYFRGPLYFFLERILPYTLIFFAHSPDGKHLRLRSRTTDAAAYVQIFILREYEFDLAFRPKIIIDAGANIGFSAIYFSLRYPESFIIALEPEADNYKLLSRNVASYPNILPLNKALWSENQSLKIIDPGKGKWGYQVHGSASARKGRVLGSVEGVTINQIMSDFGLSHIDLLKMDIEGSEKSIFESSNTWISSVGVIAIELHEWLYPGCTKSFSLAAENFEHVMHKGENIIVFRDAYWPRTSKCNFT